MRRSPIPHTLPARAGLTLLEVLLALAILAAVLIAISPIVDAGLRAAVAAELESQAAILAASRLEEMSSGLEPLTPSAAQPCRENPALSLEVATVPQEEGTLTSVTVTVTNQPREGQSRVRVSLTRVIRTPNARQSTARSRPEGAAR